MINLLFLAKIIYTQKICYQKRGLTVAFFVLMRKTFKNLVQREKLYLFKYTGSLLFPFRINFWCHNWLNRG